MFSGENGYHSVNYILSTSKIFSVTHQEGSMMRAKKLDPIGVIAALLTLGILQTALADNYYWQNGVSGNWFDRPKWDGIQANPLPNNGNHTFYIGKDALNPYVVTVDNDVNIDSFELSAAKGKLLVPAGRTFRAAGNIKLGEVELAGTWSSSISTDTQGILSIKSNAPVITSSFFNKGNLNLTATQNSAAVLRVGFDSTNVGTMTFDSPASPGTTTLVFDTDPLEGFKRLTNGETGIINFNKGAVVDDASGARVLRGNLWNDGTINFNTKTMFNGQPGIPQFIGAKYANYGTMNFKNDSTLALRGKEFINEKVENSKALIDGKGTIDATQLDTRKVENKGGKVNVKVTPGGNLRAAGPGILLPQIFTIEGDYDHVQQATLGVELDASSLTVMHGLLDVNGVANVTPDAQIEVSLVNSGAFLQPGMIFPVLTADTLLGSCPTTPIPDSYGVSFSVLCDEPNVIRVRVDSVPEPASAGLVLLCITGILRRQRLRRTYSTLAY
jgi:hypothetical protein